jgi:RNA polymerase sigma-70 factor (ECF subfamily)
MPEVEAFESARPMLLGLAYRILGSRADAEDAVQDTYLQWQRADRTRVENPASWLTTICTRRCIDLLRSAHRARVEYVGAWLPEPIQTTVVDHTDDKLALASTLETAFLLMLERLTPKERAAYLLHDIFDVSYPEIAKTLDLQEAACRQLVSRARNNVDQAKVRHVTPLDRQNELLAAFELAVAAGDTGRLAGMLSEDVELASDGGGLIKSISRVLVGRAEVLGFIGKALHRYWGEAEREAADLNGGRGFLVRHEGEVVGAVSFAFNEDGALTNVYLVRNPEKLALLNA